MNMSDDKIQINPRLLTILVIALVCSFMIIAFLLGRESTRSPGTTAYVTYMQSPQPVSSAPPSGASGTVWSTQPPAVVPTVSGPTSRPSSEPSFSPPSVHPVATHPALSPAGMPTATESARAPDQPPPPSGISSKGQADVKNYFMSYDAAGSAVKFWDDPNSLAQECIKASLSGDTSGLDKLIGAYRTFQYDVVKIKAPNVCKEHQSRSIEVLGYSIQVLETMKKSIATGDVEGLTNLKDQAQTLKERGDQVDQLSSQIKAKYGIPH
jgi:hypothetical protein